MSAKEHLLLHQCCAPCSASAVKYLSELYDIEGYWYNPNIEPDEEYNSRRAALVEFNRQKNIRTLFDENFSSVGNKRFSPPRISSPARCYECYRERLDKTAHFAASRGYGFFSTTLLSSPYQNHELIIRLGEKSAAEYGITFVYFDVRKKYYEGVDEIRLMGLYRQRYCGCLMSYLERNNSRKKNKTPAAASSILI